MNEPKRWLDEPGDVPEELSVLLAKAHKAPPAMGPVAKTAAAAAVAKIGAGGLVLSGAAKSVIAVVLAGTVGTGAYVATRQTSAPAQTPVSSRTAVSTEVANVARAATRSAETPRVEASPSEMPAPNAPSANVVRAEPAPPLRVVRSRPNSLLAAEHRVETPQPHVAAPAEVAEGTSPHVAPIVEEARVLESARRSLEADPARALSLIDEHASRFPSGALSEERELLAVDALLRAGRTDAARERAAAAIAAHPGGVQTARIRSLIENRRAP